MRKKEEKLRISPSLIKDFWSYQEKEFCGLHFDARWVDRVADMPKGEISEVIAYGYRFEYEMTGSIPREYREPPPKLLTSTGKPSAKQKYLEEQVKVTKEALKYYGFEMIGKDLELVADMGRYNLKAIQDYYGTRDGKKCFLDFKTTGMLNVKKWDKFSWNLEVLHQKPYLMIQPAIAKILAREKLHIEDIPYYFYIASNLNPDDCEFIEVVFDPTRLLEYQDMTEDAAGHILFEKEIGFKPYPEKKRCQNCPLKEMGCGSAIDVPRIKKIIVV